MKVELKEITVRDLVEGYQEGDGDSVVGLGGGLDIRPPYQRDFIYKDQQRDAVIGTLRCGFPLNVMYWAVNKGRNYEVIDGQQRTISICRYVACRHSVDGRYYHNLMADEKERILNYKLMVYLCEGTDSEKLGWFRTINISGEKLTEQELRNAVYSGSWVADAKRFFSKAGCGAHAIGRRYLKGVANRQEYLETAIKWKRDNIEEYMAENQHSPSASDLWLYFQAVVSWVETTFPKYRKEMKGLPWGVFYNAHKDGHFDPVGLEVSIAELMADEDVTSKKGIYAYLLEGKERHLNIRTFFNSQKREAYEGQGGVCPGCDGKFDMAGMEADHIIPWHKGGKTSRDNCQMLCRECNRRKSGA